MRVGPDFVDEYPDGNPGAAEAFATIIRAGQCLYEELERAMLASFGVPQNVLNSLAVIEGAEAPLTPSQIGERTFSSSATMTATLDALEYRGWVSRLPNPEDRRSLLIEITDEGRAITDRFLPGVRKLEQAILRDLSRTEQTSLLKLLGKVLDAAAGVAAAEPIVLEGRRNRPASR